jgi:hypothetical protein
VGLATILAGIGGMLVVLRPGIPLWTAPVAWAVGGLGMGLSYAPISLLMLREAPAGREGWASASLNLCDVLGVALGTGLGGAAVAAAAATGWTVSAGVAMAFVIAACGGLVALVVSRRLPHSTPEMQPVPAPQLVAG